MKEHRLGICGIQEVKRGVELRGRSIHGVTFFTGTCGPYATGGCGFAVNDEVMKEHGITITEVTHYNERLSEMNCLQGDHKITLLSAYAPCSTHNDQEVEEYFEFLTATTRRVRGRVLVLGDMNAHIPSEVDMAKMNRNGQHLQDMASELGMVILNRQFRKPVNKMWTWQGDTAVFSGKRVNDYVMTREENQRDVVDCEAVRPAIITDHRLVKCVYRPNWKIKPPKQRKPAEGEEKRAQLAETNAVEKLQAQVEKLAAVEAKKERKSGGIHLKKEYITKETWAAVAAKRKAFEKFRRERSDAARKQYERRRGAAKKMVRRDGNERFRKWSIEVETAFAEGRASEGYRAMQGIYRPRARRGGITRGREAREGLTTYTEQLLNTTSKPPVPLPAQLKPVITTHRISDEVPDEKELEEALAHLRDTAPGRDGVRVRWIKGNKGVKKAVFDLVREAWKTGTIPRAWTEATVVMLQKVAGAKKWEDHRGITLLSVTGKLVTRIMLHRAREIELLEVQHGFRQARSTTGPVCYLKNLAQQARKRRTEVVAVFVDLTKAYDSVDRLSLWQALTEYGFGPRALNMVRAVYRDDVVVRLDGIQHDRSFSTTRGVRQGCLLSPFFFNLMIDKVFRTLQPQLEGVQWLDEDTGQQWSSTAIAYADDIVLFAPSMAAMQRNLDKLTAHMAAVQLTVSVKKTKFMLLGTAPAKDNASLQGPGGESDEEGGRDGEEGVEGRRAAEGRGPGGGGASAGGEGIGRRDGEEMEETAGEGEGKEGGREEETPRAAAAGKAFVLWLGREGQRCPECAAESKTATTLRVHLKRRHNIDATVGKAPLPQKVVVPDEGQGAKTCPKCLAVFSTAHNLRLHYKKGNCVLAQQIQRVPTCRYCLAQFSAKDLASHLRIGDCGRKQAEALQCMAETRSGKPCIRKKPCDLHPDSETACKQCGEMMKCVAAHKCRQRYQVQFEEQHPARAEETPREEEVQPQVLVVYGQNLERVGQFRYLGRIIADDDDDGPEIVARLHLAQGTVARLRHNVFGPTCITTKTKVRVFNTVCMAQLMYGSESWRVKKKMQARLTAYQQRCLRQMTRTSPTITMDEEGKKQIKMPKREVVLQRAGVKDIVRGIEHAQLRWFGHVLRMDSGSEVRRSYRSRFGNKGLPGFANEALVTIQMERRMRACGLEAKDAGDREKWRNGIEKVKEEDVRAEEGPRSRRREICGAKTKSGVPCQNYKPCRHHPG